MFIQTLDLEDFLLCFFPYIYSFMLYSYIYDPFSAFFHKVRILGEIHFPLWIANSSVAISPGDYPPSSARLLQLCQKYLSILS